MAWRPVTNFEKEVVELQPDHDFILGQLQYEAKQNQEYTPRPKEHLDFAMERSRLRHQKLNSSSSSSTTTTNTNTDVKQHKAISLPKVQEKLDMMERIQNIAGTKKLGDHAKLEDWEDNSNVEHELISMMRHFGMTPMLDGQLDPEKTIPTLEQKKNIYISHNGRRRIPLLLDNEFFKAKPLASNASSSANSSSSSSNNFKSTNYSNNFYTNLNEYYTNVSNSSETESYSTANDSLSSLSSTKGDNSDTNEDTSVNYPTANCCNTPYQNLMETSKDSYDSATSTTETQPLLNELELELENSTNAKGTIAEDAMPKKKRNRRGMRPNQKKHLLT